MMMKHAYEQPELIGWFTPKVRQWFYGVLTMSMPLLIGYGVLDNQQAALWVALAGAVLGLGTAGLHTPVKSPPRHATGNGGGGDAQGER